MDNFKYGHWVSSEEVNEDKYIGFLYCIKNKENGRKYLGRKRFKVKKKKNDWKTYTGSCKELNADILELGKDKFEFVILKQCTTGPELNYQEAKLIIINDAIFRKSFYNKMILLRTKGQKIYE